MYFEGLSCPVCHAPFTASDDMVVCPKCGLPHHRECWHKENRCAMDAFHGTENQWRKEKKIDKTTQDNSTYENAPSQEYTPSYTPHPVFEQPAQNQYIDDVSITDLGAMVGNNSHYYLPRFLRLSQKQSGGFNWAALIFGQWWLIYRKQYFFGILLLIIQTALDLMAVFLLKDIPDTATMTEVVEMVMQNPLSVPWALAYYGYLFTHIFLAFRGNKMYLRHCQKKIRTLRSKTPNLSSAELVSFGGTATGHVAILYMLSYLLSLAINYFTM